MSSNKLIRFAFLNIIGLLYLTSCILQGQDQDIATRATWTPVVQPTDQPYSIQSNAQFTLDETPVLVVFGSQDPEDDTPLKVLNIATDDVYDVSSIPPAPFNEWSRPILAEGNDVFFQVGGTLYVLSPEGQTRSIELPYDEDDPAFCNWSWQGQLVCLNNAMTTGFLVSQELRLADLQLPADGIGEGSATFFEPYRVGESVMRSVLTSAMEVNGNPTVVIRDLNLETRELETLTIPIENLFNFSYAIKDDDGSITSLTPAEGPTDILGVSDDLNAVYIRVRMRLISGGFDGIMLWAQAYDVRNAVPRIMEWYVRDARLDNRFYKNTLITTWRRDADGNILDWPSVYNLKTGQLIFDTYSLEEFTEMHNFILPYGYNWFVGQTSGLQYLWGMGNVALTFAFPDEITESMEADSIYTITQPIEP